MSGISLSLSLCTVTVQKHRTNLRNQGKKNKNFTLAKSVDRGPRLEAAPSKCGANAVQSPHL